MPQMIEKHLRCIRRSTITFNTPPNCTMRQKTSTICQFQKIKTKNATKKKTHTHHFISFRIIWNEIIILYYVSHTKFSIGCLFLFTNMKKKRSAPSTANNNKIYRAYFFIRHLHWFAVRARHNLQPRQIHWPFSMLTAHYDQPSNTL